MRAYQSLTFCSETIRHTTANCNLSLSLRSVGATKSFLAVLIPTPSHSFIAAVFLFFLQSFSETGSNNDDDDECKVQVKIIY
jgi:ABC-type sulfate transport system permease component